LLHLDYFAQKRHHPQENVGQQKTLLVPTVTPIFEQFLTLGTGRTRKATAKKGTPTFKKKAPPPQRGWDRQVNLKMLPPNTRLFRTRLFHFSVVHTAMAEEVSSSQERVNKSQKVYLTGLFN
jgi:hypothetical protein